MSTLTRNNSRSTTPSALCADSTLFDIWLATFEPRIELVDEACPFWPELGTFDIPIVNGYLERAAPRDPQYRKHYDAMLPFLNLQPILGADFSDEWELCANATTIYSTYETFHNFSNQDEANMRRAVDNLVSIVYPAHSDPFSSSEASFTLPGVPLPTHELCKLSEKSTAKADAAVSSTVPLDLSGLSLEEKARRRTDANYRLFTVKRVKRTPLDTILIPRLIWEYKMAPNITVENQVRLDGISSLLHRRHIGREDLPIRLFSITPIGATYYECYWDHGVPVIREYEVFRPLQNFQDWLSFYLALVRMRRTFETESIAPIPAAQVGLFPWKNFNGSTEENSFLGGPPVTDDGDAHASPNIHAREEDAMQDALPWIGSPDTNASYQEAFTPDDSPAMVHDDPRSNKTAARSPSDPKLQISAVLSPFPTRPKENFLGLLNYAGTNE